MFCYEVCIDGRSDVCWVESVFVIVYYEGCFVDVLCVEDDDFGFEGRYLVVRENDFVREKIDFFFKERGRKKKRRWLEEI